MATPEHCLYCFESLAASLDKNLTPFSLTDVQNSYAAYLVHLKDAQASPSSAEAAETAETTAAAILPKKLPALARLTDASSSSSSLSSGASSSTSLSTTTTAATSTTTPRERVTDPDARYPLFVTWDKAHQTSSSSSPSSPDEWHLRGCIGTFSAESPLSECLAEYAAISALHDTRFSPVSRSELAHLRCVVTLLTNFEDCAAWDDWVVGEHGIKIRFQARGRSYSGTYLPSVAAEQEWTKEETMFSLMRKAGWRGSHGQWQELATDPSMRVERYRGDKEEVAFAEYKQWREWASENWEEA